MSAGEPPVQSLRDALLWYEDCETVKGRNVDKGVRITSATVVEGKIGKALLFERPYANQLKNPDFDSLDAWIAVGRPQTCKDGGWFSPACARITEADYLRQVITDLRAEEKAWYCLSVYAKSDTPGTRLVLRVDRDISKEFPLTPEYVRAVLPFQAAYENSTVTLQVRGAGAAVVDGVQLEEQRSFPSTFCPTARRPTQQIEIAVSEKTLNVAEGSIAFWVQPMWIGENGTGQSLFAWWCDADNPGAENLALSAYPGWETDHDWHNRILLTRTRAKRHDCLVVKSLPLSELWKPGSWHHVVAVWKTNPGQLTLYLDGKPMPQKEGPWGEVKMPKLFYFGYYWGAYADAAFDEICVFKRALTPEEADALFKLQAPLLGGE